VKSSCAHRKPAPKKLGRDIEDRGVESAEEEKDTGSDGESSVQCRSEIFFVDARALNRSC
jgi:hypothetical protein